MKTAQDYVKGKIEELKTRDLNTLYTTVAKDQFEDYAKHEKKLLALGVATPKTERVKENTFFMEKDPHKTWITENKRRLSHQIYKVTCVRDGHGEKVITAGPVRAGGRGQRPQEKTAEHTEVLEETQDSPQQLREVREYYRNDRHEIVHRDAARMPEIVMYLDKLYGRLYKFNNDYSLFLLSYWEKADEKVKTAISHQVDKLFIGFALIIEKLWSVAGKESKEVFGNLLEKIKEEEVKIDRVGKLSPVEKTLEQY